MVNSELLEQKIVHSGKTKSYLSNKIGITLQTFKKKCTNNADFFLSEVDILCTELDIKKPTEKEKIFFNK